ncbi:MAG: esterase-like activity of phytase family protein [Lamprocystis purpurea]|uniref:esterase-like activity of phytase family protein n=1 Tax=Lamprocystis purpurea TaxID=61598 RepID=UPI00037337BD|nr:esterase-like activity of phytase family protein [Lamprocystis purpurea]MBV5275933.1 esterase-like activity of phytase family protein [Lamprocystis purpurea]
MKIQHRRLANPFLCALAIAALLPLPSQAGQGYGDPAARFATFNVSLNRGTQGQLAADLASGDNVQARAVAEIIQRTAPEVILLNEFDYDAAGTAVDAFREQYLQVSQNGQSPIRYPYVFFASANTGIPSGYDLNNDGTVGGPDDAFGFGAFPGQYGMVVLSQHPILLNGVRTFQTFRWQDMPGALLPDDPSTPEPDDWYSAAERAVLRLSSKSHWDLPIAIDGHLVHVLASHPTPPTFDGAEDRNGRRNADEIRFWADYVTPRRSGYIYDDEGVKGGLERGAAFVIMGDLNADPQDGDSFPGAIAQLLGHQRVAAAVTPVSLGGPDAAVRQGADNDTHTGDPAEDTADFSEPPGNLRVDYVLPSRPLSIQDAGVFWPTADDPLFGLVGDYPFPSSDHRLVWADVRLTGAPQVAGLNLAFIGEAVFPTGYQFAGTEVGGLSGIDYDPRRGTFVAISDDRSQIDAARFYRLAIDLTDGQLASADVRFLDVTTLLDETGAPFAPSSLDPESIRIARDGKSLFWTSEGDAGNLIAPFVRQMTWGGRFVRELRTPEKFAPTADQSAGIRNNLAFESLTLSPGGDRLFTATENALYQDGPAASLATGSPVRVLEYGPPNKQPLREFIYQTDPVADAPDPTDGFSTNGLVEMLALDTGRFLMLERSFSVGRGNRIKLFESDTRGATDVARRFSILDGRTPQPMRKRLLLDFGRLPGVILDNVEGMTFGPRLANGSRTLIFVSDNNFSPDGQFTQFLAFKVVE